MTGGFATLDQVYPPPRNTSRSSTGESAINESEPVDDERSHKRKKLGCLKGCLAFIAAVMLVPVLFVWFVSPGVHYIGWRPSGKPYATTEFEFRFGHATRYVSDPGNHMQWVYGELPESITVADGKRLIVYNDPKAMIKSWGDSMEVQDDSLKHKGYMGIWDEGTHFVVDSSGVIQDVTERRRTKR